MFKRATASLVGGALILFGAIAAQLVPKANESPPVTETTVAKAEKATTVHASPVIPAVLSVERHFAAVSAYQLSRPAVLSVGRDPAESQSTRYAPERYSVFVIPDKLSRHPRSNWQKPFSTAEIPSFRGFANTRAREQV